MPYPTVPLTPGIGRCPGPSLSAVLLDLRWGPQPPRDAAGSASSEQLAFIDAYTLVNGRAPGRADIQHFVRITPPSVHQMLLALERDGPIGRQKGVARSIRFLVNPAHLPRLQPVRTPHKVLELMRRHQSDGGRRAARSLRGS